MTKGLKYIIAFLPRSLRHNQPKLLAANTKTCVAHNEYRLWRALQRVECLKLGRT